MAPTSGDMIQAIGSPAEWGAVPIRSSMASAYLSAALTITGDPTWYELGAGAETYTESYDPGSNFDNTGTGRYTCPVDGCYSIEVLGSFSITGGSAQLLAALLGIGIDGVVAVGVCGFSDDDPVYQYQGGGSYTFQLSAEQTISLFYYAAESSTNNPVLAAGATFSVHLISRV